MAFLIVFGAGTVLLGVAYVISIIVTRGQHQGTANWPKVTGTVKQAFIYQHERSTSSGTDTTYTPVVGYTYAVAGQEYQAFKRNFLPYNLASLASMSAAQAVRARYTVDSDVMVYYNPNNPAQAALEIPKATAHTAVLWYGIVCMLLGSGMIALGIVWP